MTPNPARYLLGLCTFCWRPAHTRSSSFDDDNPEETIVRWRACRRHSRLSITRCPTPKDGDHDRGTDR